MGRGPVPRPLTTSEIAAIELFRNPYAWQERCREARSSGARIVLVPTMGFLHEGHLSLMREARRRVDETVSHHRGLAVATIFVNPTQFGPNEDVARYPRDLDGDVAKCASAGIDWVFAPESADQLFPSSFQTWVEVTGVSHGLCGARRPGHFRGVATIVSMLFNLTGPQVAIFGEKDYQQLQVIRAMVRDLCFGIEIAGMPIVRDPDGLAMSSRNTYLSAGERIQGLSLSKALFAARDAAERGRRIAHTLVEEAASRIEAAGARVDYVEVVHPETLAPVERADPGSIMLVAAFVGKTRLIDNQRLP
jgi:pantoate--beta-alanine ligase